MLKGKQIELVILVGQFPFVGIVLGGACFTFVCKLIKLMVLTFGILSI
jgi:hypothetical protein